MKNLILILLLAVTCIAGCSNLTPGERKALDHAAVRVEAEAEKLAE